MNWTPEMKLLVIDKMLDVRKQLITIQRSLDMSSLSYDTTVLVYLFEDLLELSEMTGSEIYKDHVSDGVGVCVALEYKRVVFDTYISPDEYEAYMNRRGDETAAPQGDVRPDDSVNGL